ncbi:MAG TPA: hypothetical protein PKE21_03395 [Flavobacteriales bacterium]|nr:hypothetical protein [Flavobacteriales bacterium]HMR26502.1 hypothetical protein [Flavobacteriales bacterium]
MTERERLHKLKEEADRFAAQEKADNSIADAAQREEMKACEELYQKVHRLLERAKSDLENAGFKDVEITMRAPVTTGEIGSITATFPPSAKTTTVVVSIVQESKFEPSYRSLRIHRKNDKPMGEYGADAPSSAVTKFFP